jgi:murein DD-endopeptidase MepM/ murein hydrolase activator NlpD
VRPFTPPEQRWLSGHRGVDLHAPGPGVAILAPSAGRVRFSGRVGGKDVVVIEHAQGLRSTFEPAISSLAVGAAVSRGQAVAAVGPSSGHCAPTTCLHWGVLRGEVYLDPLSFIGPLGVRLLPLR